MMHAIRQEVVVLPGGRIEIVSPELTPGASAEVIVLEKGEHEPAEPGETQTTPLSLAERRAFLMLPLRERRRILAEQADRMAGHYERDAEARELGGGDFVDC